MLCCRTRIVEWLRDAVLQDSYCGVVTCCCVAGLVLWIGYVLLCCITLIVE